MQRWWSRIPIIWLTLLNILFLFTWKQFLKCELFLACSCGCFGFSAIEGGAHTLGVQLGPVLGETFESNSLPKEMKELFQRRTGRFVVVHLFLATLACHAVHYPHFPLETQLRTEKRFFAMISRGSRVKVFSPWQFRHFQWFSWHLSISVAILYSSGKHVDI